MNTYFYTKLYLYSTAFHNLYGPYCITLLTNASVHTQVDHCSLVPPLIMVLASAPDVVRKYDLSQITNVDIAAAPLTVEGEKILRKVLPNAHVTQSEWFYQTIMIYMQSE